VAQEEETPVIVGTSAIPHAGLQVAFRTTSSPNSETKQFPVGTKSTEKISSSYGKKSAVIP
jgi:hypothetical protein